jgi:hypothetical protein
MIHCITLFTIEYYYLIQKIIQITINCIKLFAIEYYLIQT